ncbi:MAG TPA: aminotransferase class I/II-fold pyridoxal phosphate-dependent enzyme [Alphaproteobacteria bacterium]|nr:aminotransferase class I/II-fold pyridoxal phosphate-dependent enzyme [Alphaproteobacteria bacterium]
MNINEYLVRDSDTLASALRVIDRNGLGLAFAVDSEGRLRGALSSVAIREQLSKGGSLDARVATAMTTAECAPADSDAETIAQRINGVGHIVALLDAERRPIEFASPARPQRIPVAEPALLGNELKYVTECITTNWISSQGSFVRRFETEFAARLGVPHALAVSNGTVALHLALKAFEIGPGDEVIVPDLTFAATINSVLHAGATPVIVDVDPLTWNIDPAAIAAVITPRTRAIMPVHLYGQPADMDAIMALAERHALIVIEDAAEAAGALHKGRPCGSIGHAGTFSFFSNKVITTGEGGMVVLRDERAAERARRLRDHGMSAAKRYWHDEVGFNYRLTNLQAAIGCAQLEQFDGFLQRKLAIAQAYRARLERVGGLRLPAEIDGMRNSYWMVSLIAELEGTGLDRDAFMARLGKAGIETRPLFYPLHEMPPYRAYAGNRAFPNATHLSAHGLSLPSGVTLKDAQLDYVCGVIERCLTARSLVRRTGTA